MADDPAPLLRRPGQKAGNVHERHERDVEGIAEADEARRLHGGVDVEGSGQRAGVVRDDSDRVTAEPRERADDALGPELVHLGELAVVNDAFDHGAHVVRLRRLVRDQCVELGVLSPDRVGGVEPGGGSTLFCGRNERR